MTEESDRTVNPEAIKMCEQAQHFIYEDALRQSKLLDVSMCVCDVCSTRHPNNEIENLPWLLALPSNKYRKILLKDGTFAEDSPVFLEAPISTQDLRERVIDGLIMAARLKGETP